MKHILIIEDDTQLGEVIGAYLTAMEYAITLCNTAEEGLDQARRGRFDCILLDLTLPDEDGLVVLRKLTGFCQSPVIICSARGTSEDKIAGLEFGARDYLAKPFAAKELLLRLQNVLDTSAHEEKGDQEIRLGQRVLDLNNKYLVCKDNPSMITHLTAREFALLDILVKHNDRVYSRAELLDAVSGLDGPESERAVDVTISRLRKKIEDDPKQPVHLKTVTGFGYRLSR